MHTARSSRPRRAPAGGPCHALRVMLTTVSLVAAGTPGAGCAAGRAAAATQGSMDPVRAPVRAAVELRPGRILLLPTKGAALERSDPDGTRRLIARGVRLTERADGSVESASELIPGAPVQFLELPDRLGGGFLFWTTASSETLVYRTHDWLGALEPFARLDLTAEAFAAGFDRLYITLRESAEVVALDARSGKVTDFGPLPPSPTFRRLAFADAWFGVVTAPLRGALASFDAGASWHPVHRGDVYSLGLGASVSDGSGIMFGTERGAFLLDASGRVRQATGEQVEGIFGHGEVSDILAVSTAKLPPAPRAPRRPLGDDPLRTAVLRGWPDTTESAVIAVEGTLGRVRLRDGKVLEVREQALPESGSCQALALEAGFGFVCGEERGRTRVYAFRSPLGLERVLDFEQPRFVASSGNGALVVRGACAADARPEPRARAYCVRSRRGELQEVRVTGDLGAERVVALRLGGAAVLIPPRLGAPGQLSIVSPTGKVETRKLRLPSGPPPSRAILRKGLWLDAFTELEDGTLAGWVAGADQLIGVRVEQSGKVRAGKSQENLARTLSSGPRAIVMGPGGVLRETTNYGFEWSDIDLPPQLDLTSEPARATPRGCSPVGCASTGWVRIGWGTPPKSQGPRAAPLPEPTVFPSTRGGRWLVRCAPTGRAVSTPRVVVPPLVPRRRSLNFASSPVLRAEDVESTAWTPFLGAPPPPRAAEAVALDHETEGVDRKIHAYTWGPRGADWTDAGSFVVRATDPFELDPLVWSTAPTRSPWRDVVAAAQAFGHNIYGAPSPSFGVSLEPEGRRGLLFVTTMSTGLELYVLEEKRPILKVRDAAGLGVAAAAGVVKVAGTFYFGADGEPFRIVKLEGDRASVLGTYPKLLDGPAQASLQVSVVRSARTDGLALWARSIRTRGSSTSWFVYPVDPENGAIGEPLFIPPAKLADFPRSCEPDEDGWLLEGPPPVSPHLELVGAEAERSPRELRARMLANERGVCALALSAELDTAFTRSPAPGDVAQRPVPLTLVGTGENRQRWGFRCSR